MKYFIFIVAFCALTLNAFSIEKTIKLDSEFPTIQSYISPAELPNHQQWDKFSRENKNWTISLEPISQTPAIAFGTPIKIDCDYALNSSNIETAAKSFLTKYQSIFNINVNNLKLKRAENALGKWFVRFVQQDQGAEVLFSEVELRINDKAEVFAFRVHYFNNIDIFPTPTITPKSALALASAGIATSKVSSNILLSDQKVDDKLFVLPIYKNGKLSYKLAYKSEFKTSGEPGNYFAYVDAHNGDLLWRENKIQDVKGNINFTISTIDKYPIEPEVVKNLPYFKLTVNGNDCYSDNSGNMAFEIESPESIIFPLESKYCAIYFEGGSGKNTKIETLLNIGDNSISLDDNNSNKYERFALYHLNHAHSWIKNIDTAINCMENKFTVINYFEDIFQSGGNANAFSSGDTIGFVMYQHETDLLSTSPAVLYHEYGHSTTTNFYKQRGATSEINMSCHEAIADITASYMMDTPHMGVGVFKNEPTKTIRELKNNNIYPDSIQGESHYDSQIFSGAMWDMRELIGLEKSEKIVHFARYGMPDDADYGTACAEWLIEILIADDDNGNLADGTPDMTNILTAFNNHHIGLNLLIPGLFEHKVLDDNFSDASNISITAGFKPTVLPIALPSSIKLVYSLDNYATTDTLEMLKDENNFSSDINVGNKPAMVQYYFIIGDDADQLIKSETNSLVYNYNFLTGFHELGHENFENADNLTIENNTSSEGGFEIAVPQEFALNIGIPLLLQPGTDMSKDGDKCLITGASLPTEYNTMQDLFKYSLYDGKISATTKSFNVYNHHDIYISFYIYEFYIMFSQNEDNENNYIKVECSENDSGKWITIHEVNKHGLSLFTQENYLNIRDLSNCNSVWKRILVKVPDEFAHANSLKVRISAGANALTNAIVETCVDDLQILTPIHPTSVNETNLFTNAKVYPNPCKNSAEIQLYSKTDGMANIRLFNSNGELLGQNNAYMALGDNQMNAGNLFPQFQNLPSGTYFIDFNIDSMIYTLPLIISK
ncbi:MAG: T9SS type A sorting domain-containing protein [bacterium]